MMPKHKQNCKSCHYVWSKNIVENLKLLVLLLFQQLNFRDLLQIKLLPTHLGLYSEDTWLTEFRIDRIRVVLQKGYVLYA